MERTLSVAMGSLRDSVGHQVAPDEFARWTQAIANGDETAFCEFFDLWSRRLFEFLLRLCRGDGALAQEIHQITLIKAARSFRAFGSEAEIRGWLCRIARNSFLDHLRREDVFRRAIGLLPKAGMQDSGLGQESDLLCALENAMRGCTIEEEALLHAFYREGRSHKEIAADLGISAKAVERRLAKVRENLRKRITKAAENERLE